MRKVIILIVLAVVLGFARYEPVHVDTLTPSTENTTEDTAAVAGTPGIDESPDAWWKMLVLGVIQGLTEFLPVSSSGHLVLTGHYLGFSEAGLAGVIFLHLGTLVALIVFFARRIWFIFRDLFRTKEERNTSLKLILYIAVGSIPAAIVGILARGSIDRIVSNPMYVPFFLAGTGAMLLLTRWVKGRGLRVRLSDALIIGVAQAAAILPGLSRSGLTIATALLLGITSEEAFEFSFLLSLPAILAANLLDIREIISLGSPLVLALGFAASFGVGLFALWVLKKLVVSRKFWLFSIYCFAVGAAGIVLFFVLGR